MGKKARSKAERKSAPAVPRTVSNGSPRTHVLFLAVSIFSAALAMQPVLDNDFTNIDDPRYVTENEILLSGRVQPFLSGIYFGHYNPLTMLTYVVDFRLGGAAPSAYHATNFLLHLSNTALVYLFVSSLTRRRWPTVVAAMLFAVHPTQVEPVAWISCRKDLLYTTFYLLGQLAYVRYVRRGANSVLLLAVAYFGFVAAALSKAVAMTFPLIMILIDYVLERRTSARFWIEKIPFFATSALVGYVAMVAQKSVHAVAVEDPYSLFDRLVLVSYAPPHYLGKLVLPTSLSMLYPYPRVAGPVLLAPLLTAALIALVLLSIRSTRWVAFGFGFFLAGLAPVLQIVAVGSAIAADRYTYIPFVGLFLLIGMGLERLSAERPVARPAIMALGAAVMIASIVLSRARADVWQNSLTLWNDQVSKQPSHALAYNMRGRELIKQGKFDAARRDVDRAISLDPKVINPWINRAGLRAMSGDSTGALGDLERAVAIDPRDFEAQFNRGLILESLNRHREAAEAFRAAAAVRPDDVRPVVARGRALELAGDYEGAIAELSRATAIDPRSAEAYEFRGIANQKSGRHSAAVEDFSRYLELRPNVAGAYVNRSISLRALGDRPAAFRDAQKAVSLGWKADPAYVSSLR